MTVQVKRKVIAEFSFELTELPGFAALTAFQRFLAIAGPLLPTLASAFKLMKGQTGTEMTAESRGKLLETIADTLPKALAGSKPGELEELSKVLLQDCLVQPKGGKMVRFLEVADELMRGRLPVLLQLIAWAVGVHFGSFFAELGALAPAAAPPAAPVGPSSS